MWQYINYLWTAVIIISIYTVLCPWLAFYLFTRHINNIEFKWIEVLFLLYLLFKDILNNETL
jgi:hypothetical protein